MLVTSNQQLDSPMRRLIVILSLALLGTPAFAVKVADITRLNGARTNVLIGRGLVIGLKGTGDGGAYLPAIRMLSTLLAKFSDTASLAELQNAQNVAVVDVMATIPPNGVRNGDHLDITILSDGAAVSLRGGQLFVTPMLGPTMQPFIPHDADGNPLRPIPFALASGPVDLEDPTAPLTGIVKGGAVMEVDLPAKYIDNAGRFTLILDDPSASWTMSSTIAKLINEAGDTGENIATAIDPKNIIVTIPQSERQRPDSFISAVLRLPVPLLPTEARVVINDKTGDLIITGDVEISPVVISHKGLTITTVLPAPIPTPRNPVLNSTSSIPLDTTNQGGAKLQDLANAFDQLKVPADDRIIIVKELYKTGKLHAKLIVDGQPQ
jgi:flagellar P-ring protein FlgI